MNPSLRNMPFAYDNETVLVKSRGAWHQADVVETLRKHHELLPVVKMIMLVRDPIHRYVSDLVHFNNKEKKKGRETFSDFDAIISGKVNPGRYFDYNGKTIVILRNNLTSCLERSVHQICMDLSDYATMYEQLHSFYPKVKMTAWKINWRNYFSRIKFSGWMEMSSLRIQ